MSKPIRLAFTMGDPAGIGPEITAKATRQMAGLVASGQLDQATAEQIKAELQGGGAPAATDPAAGGMPAGAPPAIA